MSSYSRFSKSFYTIACLSRLSLADLDLVVEIDKLDSTLNERYQRRRLKEMGKSNELISNLMNLWWNVSLGVNYEKKNFPQFPIFGFVSVLTLVSPIFSLSHSLRLLPSSFLILFANFHFRCPNVKCPRMSVSAVLFCSLLLRMIECTNQRRFSYPRLFSFLNHLSIYSEKFDIVYVFQVFERLGMTYNKQIKWVLINFDIS